MTRQEYIIHKGLNINDYGKWILKWQGLKDNAKIRSSICLLTFEEYIDLVVEANLHSPDQIGRTMSSYQMARYGDSGDYEVGNCRFITMAENQMEKRINGGFQVAASKIKGRNKNNDDGCRRVSISRSKSFELISPDGIVYHGSNLREFCEKFGLNPGNMSSMCAGKLAHCKGWVGKYKNNGDSLCL